MARMSPRRMAALLSLQILSTVLSAQSETLNFLVRTFMQSDQLPVVGLIISYLLLTRRSKARICRRIWTAHPENEIGQCDGFWEQEVLHTWNVARRISPRWWRASWRANFRMSQSTFCYLLRRYGHLIKRQSTHLRRSISPAKRLAVTLYYLCQGESFQEVAMLFHIGPSTVGKIVHETVLALYGPLAKDSIVFPVGRQLLRTMRKFEELNDLPQCAGAVDGTFLRIIKPEEYGDMYWCYKGFSALVLFACVDSDGLFTFVDVGLPGSVGDAAAYNNSQLKANIEQGKWLNAPSWQCLHATVRPYLVGDSAFSLSSTLMKIYPDNGALTPVQSSFNAAQIRTRRVVECKFGRLKKRFQIISNCQSNDPVFASRVGILCCALDNVIERRKKGHTAHLADCASLPVVPTPSSHADAVRDNLAIYIHNL